ncbi:hypothetical protein ACHMZP_34245 [Rhodococcus baikonurensis]|uniref:5-methylcytosine restriction system specificity protein McrC n=1 Tax=Rhodococcus baikonurensis TaxID=172041 RepID=UPI0037987502
MEIRYDEYDEDIAENQLLLAATLILLDSAVVPPRLQRRLARLGRAFADVTPATAGAEPSPARTRLNERYHWALQLSELITEHRSIEHRIGDVVVRGFVLDIWTVFSGFPDDHRRCCDRPPRRQGCASRIRPDTLPRSRPQRHDRT